MGSKCECLSCKHSRGEITTEQYLFGMENRLEVWKIVQGYFSGYCQISEENLHTLGQNVDCAIEEIEELIACTLEKAGNNDR